MNHISIEIAACLSAIHADKFIHLNITPDHILIQPNPQPNQFSVKLCSFSHAMQLIAVVPNLGSENRMSIVSPYMSPEQTGRFNAPIGFQSDLYSLGACMYELLTGVPPFIYDSPARLILQILAVTPDDPSKFVGYTHPPLNNIIMKLLSKQLAERYQSAIGLLSDLRSALASNTPFELGTTDVGDNFCLPDRVIGREREKDSLRRVVLECKNGGVGFLFIGGWSGVGKTSLVRSMVPGRRREGEGERENL